MKAIILKKPGSVANFEKREIQEPSINDEEVLVKVSSISINPVDAKTRKGQGVFIYAGLDPNKELIIGWDISGVVTASRSDLFKPGDEVFGMVNFVGVGAAYAEFVAAPASHLAIKPNTISHPEAAAATLAALTAWQNIVTVAKIKQGDRVFIHGAAGGVGHYAVQIAKYFGAYVIGSSSPANKDFVLSNGADEHFDYTTQVLSESIKDVDFILESRDNESILHSLKVIRSGGRLISIASQISEEAKAIADSRSIEIAFTFVTSNGSDMKDIAKLLNSGNIKSHISRQFTFDEIPEAHTEIEKGKTVGKIIVNI